MSQEENTDLINIPIEFGVVEDGTVRMIVHSIKPEDLGHILRQLGERSEEIVSTLEVEVEAFIRNKIKVAQEAEALLAATKGHRQ